MLQYTGKKSASRATLMQAMDNRKAAEFLPHSEQVLCQCYKNETHNCSGSI